MAPQVGHGVGGYLKAGDSPPGMLVSSHEIALPLPQHQWQFPSIAPLMSSAKAFVFNRMARLFPAFITSHVAIENVHALDQQFAGLGLNSDEQSGGAATKRCYISPHLRNKEASRQDSNWDSRGGNGYINGTDDRINGCHRNSYDRDNNSSWNSRDKDEYSSVGSCGKAGVFNARDSIEQELFSGGNTGINFEKYDDIPVEATGNNCPPHIESFQDVHMGEIIMGNI
ncbi:Hypothetical predicted protein [Pelobates cultripes]|uniref:Uncharacterized protein n=1 Tax=Pelobates cultripes TaxID=61616 RepID=A0AAD1WV87_PELCU|nr:Hypothetical predicted protein [Pelobates cultripes]